MANDHVVTGRKYRILSNATSRIWDVISFWTKSQDVEMTDGTNLQDSFDTLSNKTNQNVADIADLTDGNTTTVSTGPAYSNSKKYKKGDIVFVNGTLYYCLVDMNAPEEWTVSHWQSFTSDTKLPFSFGIDPNGKYGYKKVGADSVTPFSGSMELITDNFTGDYTFTKPYSSVMIIYNWYRYYSWLGNNDSASASLSMSLGNNVITGSSETRLSDASKLTDTATPSDRWLVVSAVCQVEDVNIGDSISAGVSVTQQNPSGETIAYGTSKYGVLVGIE